MCDGWVTCGVDLCGCNWVPTTWYKSIFGDKEFGAREIVGGKIALEVRRGCRRRRSSRMLRIVGIG